MTIVPELEDFAASHRSHGSLLAETGPLTPNGYRLAVVCHCGLTFERWITPEEAARDLAVLSRRNLTPVGVRSAPRLPPSS